MTVTGTQLKGAVECTVPVMVGRRSRHYSTITAEQWRTLRRDSSSEFAVNEALADLGDIRLTGEINRYRGYSQTKDILEMLHREAHHRVDEILRELVEVERVLYRTKIHLEMANAYQEIHDRFTRSFTIPRPIHPPPTPPSPETTPFVPRRGGPTEQPLLADACNPRKKCYCCGSTSHKVAQCTARCVIKRCNICSSTDHKTKRCAFQKKNRTPTPPPSKFDKAVEAPEMSVLEKIALLDREEWTPEVCSKCGKTNAKHTELECPLYEQCPRCRNTGAYGFLKRHVCYPLDEEKENVVTWQWNEADHDLLWQDGSD
ncbi:hypothetical protein EI94DRAFT_1706684 [Lactarius quietus]|nr:hypothetical protein EI94DRAFT_1706684 [Lactarius quietus]